MGGLISTVVGSALGQKSTDGPESSTGKAASSKDPAPPKIGAKSKVLWRVIDESLGYALCGQTVEIIDDDDSVDYHMCRIQGKIGGAVGGNVVACKRQLEDISKLVEPAKTKPIILKLADRLILDVKFPAYELEGHQSLEKDHRCCSIHISMGWWLIERDCQDSYKGPTFLPRFASWSQIT